MQTDLASPEPQQLADSPGAQTLAALKEEARKDPPSKGRKSKIPSKPRTTRRKVTRSCQIMKEEYFEGMAWTRTFVSGPVDPKWNRYKFYCQICKGNVSIYGKVAREILRHYATEKHLRKDQRWRYEHLSTVDPLTKIVQHQVRGRDGKVLTPYQLELELPHFIGAELVDIGEKLPFTMSSWLGHNTWPPLLTIGRESKFLYWDITSLLSETSGHYEDCGRT